MRFAILHIIGAYNGREEMPEVQVVEHKIYIEHNSSRSNGHGDFQCMCFFKELWQTRDQSQVIDVFALVAFFFFNREFIHFFQGEPTLSKHALQHFTVLSIHFLFYCLPA
jgi:hypothetical protein